MSKQTIKKSIRHCYPKCELIKKWIESDEYVYGANNMRKLNMKKLILKM